MTLIVSPTLSATEGGFYSFGRSNDGGRCALGQGDVRIVEGEHDMPPWERLLTTLGQVRLGGRPVRP